MEESNRASHVRKRKGVQAALTTNTDKVRAIKRKINHAGHLINRPNGSKTCLVNGPVHSTEW